MTALATPIDQEQRNVMAALVRGAAAGDEHCWSQLVDRFSRLVWSIARSFGLGDADAADVSQTAWLRLAEHLDRIDHPERVGAWLATTTRRECMRVKRISTRSVPTEDLDLVDREVHRSESADADVLARVRDRSLWRAFSGLPERQRTLLLLLVADPPLSYREIADTLDMPIGSIGPTRARTLLCLRRRVEAAGISGAD
jgi:RNA polymerase sigma factor (sigma-70 family)